MLNYGEDTLGNPGVSAAERPAAKKPKFPGAKTYKDKAGNIREVGTGKLIRAAAKPVAKKAATPAKKKTGNTYFTDGQGVVRRIGTGIAKNPLDRQIDEQILQTTTPFKTGISQANQQYQHSADALTDSNAALTAGLTGLQQRIQDLGSQQLGQAAAAAGGTGAAQSANLEYLKGLLGGHMIDPSALGGANLALAGAAQSEAAGQNVGTGLGIVGQQSDLATAAASNGLRTNNLLADQLTGKNKAIQDLNNQIAVAKSNRTAIKNDLINNSLDQSAARQQIRLADAQYQDSKAQQAVENQMNQEQIDNAAIADAAKVDAAAAKANKSTVGKYGTASLDKKYDTAADQVLAMVQKTAPGARRWRNIVQLLTQHGIPGGSAVILATQWAPNRAQDPVTVFKTLTNGSLGFKVSADVAKKVFQVAGLDWKDRVAAASAKPAKPAKPGPTSGAGQYTNSYQNDGLFLAALKHNGVGDSFTIGSDTYKIVGKKGSTYTVTGPSGRQMTVRL